MSISYWQDRPEKERLHFDFCIVGGGIAGLSSAYWLEKKFPKAKIALIERHKIGAGASGRNAGFVTCGSAEHFAKLEKQFGLAPATEIWKFSEMNRELLREEIWQNDPESVQFESTGSCTVAPSREDWQRYQSLAATMQAQGIDVDLIPATTLRHDYGVQNFEGAIQYRHDGVIHPYRLLQKIRQRLGRTQIFENEEVFRLAGGRIETDLHGFAAPHILLCVNAYLGLLGPRYLELVKPQRSQILVTKPLPKFVKGPCYLTKHLCYFRQLVGGELLIGGFRNSDILNENTYTDQATEKIQSALLNFSKSYFELGPQIEVNYRWSGIMGFTEDGQMLIGTDPDQKGLHLMAGCSGHGMGLSFHAARVLVEHVAGKAPPSHLNLARVLAPKPLSNQI